MISAILKDEAKLSDGSADNLEATNPTRALVML